MHTQETFYFFTMKKFINISKGKNHFKGHGKKFNIVCTPIRRRRYCIQNIIKRRKAGRKGKKNNVHAVQCGLAG